MAKSMPSLTASPRRYTSESCPADDPFVVLVPWVDPCDQHVHIRTIVVYSFNMFGDAVRDLLDPRLRGGVGRMGAYGTKSVKKARKKPEARANKQFS